VVGRSDELIGVARARRAVICGRPGLGESARRARTARRPGAYGPLAAIGTGPRRVRRRAGPPERGGRRPALR
jgi:hypothetical protein